MLLRDALPVWANALLIAALLVGGFEVGLRLGRRRDGGESSVGHLLSATLGLLALLVGFTFALALGRHESRRLLIVSEANAIGTTYLRAQLLPEPYRARLAEQLRVYTDARIAIARAGEDAAALARAQATTDSLQGAMWATTMAGIPLVTSPPAGALLVSSMNEVIDVVGQRRAEVSARLPASVLLTLVLYALITAGMLGLVSSDSGARRERVLSVILLVLVTLALRLILDLDRPRSGYIIVSQVPLTSLRASMDASR